MKYELKLANFEGPLDLLLHLISKAKIELKDIFISEITEQYLTYLNCSEFLDLESASDFLQMAATLLYIKSRSLLPQKRQDDLDEDGLSPEERLIARLNEYKKYKTAAEEFKELEENAKGNFYKLPEEILSDDVQEQVFANANVDALFTAYLRILEKIKKQEQKEEEVVIYRDSFSVRKQMRVILARLTIKSDITFEEVLSSQPTREELAVTFLSLLELLHDGRVNIEQKAVFGEIMISRRVRNKAV